MVDDLFQFESGNSPLLISFPHSGTWLPVGLESRFTPQGAALPDTDWYLPKLYEIDHRENCGHLIANYSRYVIDLNRPTDGENLYPGRPTPKVCPTLTFSGESIYADEDPDEAEIAARIASYWQPYHKKLNEELQRIHRELGHAILLDAHSIASRVPRLFDGVLPDLNLGTHDGKACSSSIQDGVFEILKQSGYTAVCNGRFIGGYITRHYGNPQNGIHVLQLEISQATYVDEETGQIDPLRVTPLQAVLGELIEYLLQQ